MPLLSDAAALMVGSQAADAAYVGTEQVFPSGFDPLSLNPAVWLANDSLVPLADGDPITSWPNQGSLGDAEQSGAPPTKDTINGAAAGRFGGGGSEKRVILPALDGLTAGHIFVLLKVRVLPPLAGRAGLWKMGTDAYAFFPYDGDGGIYDDGGSTVRKTCGAPVAALDAWRVYEVETAAGAWTARLDGALQFTTAANAVGFPAAPQVGSNPDTGFLDGWIAELFIAPAVLSADDAAAVRDRLLAIAADLNA